MKKQQLFTIYGAKDSLNGTRVNITLVTGNDDQKEYATISIAKEGTGKVKVKQEGEFYYVKIPALKPSKKDTDTAF